LHHALDLGVNFINTADSCGDDGHYEALIGRALEGRRHEFVLATKTVWVKRACPEGGAIPIPGLKRRALLDENVVAVA
jgi:aryl-alcohol dehydrogenase-like predicted oxidoreductase